MLLTLFKKIDAWFGTPICRFLGPISWLWRRKILIDPTQAQNILVVKLVALGDWVLILPLLKRIKDTYPNKKITVLASPRVRVILEGQAFIDEILYIDPGSINFGPAKMFKVIREIKQNQFDCIIELTHYYRFIGILLALTRPGTWVGFDFPKQGKNRLRTHLVSYDTKGHELSNFMQFAKILGCDDSMPKLLVPLNIPNESRHQTELKLSRFIPPNEPFILIHPGCSPASTLRYWDDEKWVELIEVLTRLHTHKVVVIGGADELRFVPVFKQPGIINLIGQLTLLESCRLMEMCSVYVGLDTGPTHLAAAHGARIVALFGPNTPSKWGPYGTQNKCLYSPPACSPCIRQYDGIVPNRCINPQQRQCMKSISVENVRLAISEITC